MNNIKNTNYKNFNFYQKNIKTLNSHFIAQKLLSNYEY